MKNKFTLLLGAAFMALLQLAAPSVAFAQLDGIGMIVQVKTTTGTISFTQGACGYGIPDPAGTWGGTVESDICGQAAWAKDSFACAPQAANAMDGKIAIIRRKTCSFSLKAYHAQQAGAKAAIILNHFDNATEDDCTIFRMTAGDSAAAVTIPAIFASRQMANFIDNAIKTGQLQDICLVLPTIQNATADFSYATPVSQHDQLGLMTVTYTNRSGADQPSIIFKADVIDPTGQVTSFTVDSAIVAGATNKIINFPEYQVPAIEGKYRVIYSSNLYTAPKDTLVREFVQTRYTYATDNLNITGSIGPTDAQFTDAGLKYQSGSMVVTGPEGITVEYVSFGMGNASTIAVGDEAADVVNIFLYDNDADGSGTTDLDATFDALNPIALAEYKFSNEKADSLVYVKLESLVGADVVLEPNHFYLLSILYDGNLAGSGTSLSFTRSNQVYYPQFGGIGLHTPLLLDQMYSGWTGSTLVTRLHEKGFEPGNDPFITTATKTPRLSETRYTVTPNPANEVVRLNLELEGVNKSVAATLIDFQGRAVDTQIARNFQNGQLTFDATKLPSGAYSLFIRTSNEGTAMAKLMICH